jgi:hypothetical protein
VPSSCSHKRSWNRASINCLRIDPPLFHFRNVEDSWRQLINTHCPTIASYTLPRPFAQRSICALWPLVHPSIQLHQPFTHTTSEAGHLVACPHATHTRTQQPKPAVTLHQQAAMFGLVHAPSQINRRGMYPGLFASDNFFDGPFWASRPSRPLQSSWTHPSPR